VRIVLPLFLLALLIAGAPAPCLAAPPDEDHVRTGNLVAAYTRAPNWVVKAMVLLSLGERWHPKGTPILLDAFRSRDPKLRAYAVEVLRSMSAADLRVVLSADLVDELIGTQLKERNKWFRGFVRVALSCAFPDAADGGTKWPAWWKQTRGTYAPPAWTERRRLKKARESGKTVARKSVVERALELSQDGIELVLCFDSTGSMQPTINAARKAMIHVIGILEGLSPDLRVGLVHYKDVHDIFKKGEGNGAEVLSKLTPKLRTVSKKLDRLQADGGGDLPEKVYGGLWHALHRNMGWTLPASKMVVVIGDAPPRAEDLDALLALVRQAREDPAWKLDKKWGRYTARPTVTGDPKRGKKALAVRPILTSCIVTGPTPSLVMPLAASQFEEIAKAGGGVFGTMTNMGGPEAAGATIVTYLVELTFGKSYRAAAQRLAERYVFWKKKGLFK